MKSKSIFFPILFGFCLLFGVSGWFDSCQSEQKATRKPSKTANSTASLDSILDLSIDVNSLPEPIKSEVLTLFKRKLEPEFVFAFNKQNFYICSKKVDSPENNWTYLYGLYTSSGEELLKPNLICINPPNDLFANVLEFKDSAGWGLFHLPSKTILNERFDFFMPDYKGGAIGYSNSGWQQIRYNGKFISKPTKLSADIINRNLNNSCNNPLHTSIQMLAMYQVDAPIFRFQSFFTENIIQDNTDQKRDFIYNDLDLEGGCSIKSEVECKPGITAFVFEIMINALESRGPYTMTGILLPEHPEKGSVHISNPFEPIRSENFKSINDSVIQLRYQTFFIESTDDRFYVIHGPEFYYLKLNDGKLTSCFRNYDVTLTPLNSDYFGGEWIIYDSETEKYFETNYPPAFYLEELKNRLLSHYKYDFKNDSINNKYYREEKVKLLSNVDALLTPIEVRNLEFLNAEIGRLKSTEAPKKKIESSDPRVEFYLSNTL